MTWFPKLTSTSALPTPSATVKGSDIATGNLELFYLSKYGVASGTTPLGTSSP